MFKAAIGHAEGIDTERVTTEAVSRLSAMLNGEIPSALLLFASTEFDLALLLGIVTQAFPNTPLAGCTTSGEFSTELGLSDDSVALLAFISDSIRFASGFASHASVNPATAAETAYSMARSKLKEDPAVALVFPEGHLQPASRVLRSVNDVIPKGCVLAGGQAAYGIAHQVQPTQFHETGTLQDGVSMLLMAGPVEAYPVASQSWNPIGKEATVTKAEGRVIYEIDGIPALKFYRRYLGPDAEPLQEYPFAIHEPDFDEHFIRGTLFHSEEDGSMLMNGDVPEGSRIRITEATPQRLLEDTHATFTAIPQSTAEQSAVALLFSCSARKTLLGTRAGKELETLRHALPCDIPAFGFFSFGEIGPLRPGATGYMHNHTLLALFLGERGAAAECSPAKEVCAASSVPLPTTEDLKQEKEFLIRKLKRAENARLVLEDSKRANTELMLRMNKELRRSEEKYRRIVETCGEGFLLIGKDLTIQYANDAWLRMTGRTLEEVYGSNPRNYLDAPTSQLMREKTASINETEYIRLDGNLRHSNGNLVPVLIHANRLTSDSGEFIGYVSFTTDLTEQRKALRLAGEFQQSLLPQVAPQIPGLDLSGQSVPCEEVGGDYFDYLCDDSGTCGLVVADVSGHGVDASLLMSAVRSYLRSHSVNSSRLGDVISSLNAQLAKDVDKTGRFVTLFHLLVDLETRSLAWVRAGHDPAWLFDPATGEFTDLAGGGLPLGVLDTTRYTASSLDHIPEETIAILATDGIWESRNLAGEMFGKERLREVIAQNAHKDANAIRDAVFSAVRTFSNGLRQNDDLTLIIAKFGKRTS